MSDTSPMCYDRISSQLIGVTPPACLRVNPQNS